MIVLVRLEVSSSMFKVRGRQERKEGREREEADEGTSVGVASIGLWSESGERLIQQST